MSKPYKDIEKIFHEPHRLAIVSELCGVTQGLSFGDLKERCQLTDGNLSRHLSALEGEKVVKIEKSFVGAKPRTTVTLTTTGKRSFLEYLTALEQVLKAAAHKVKAVERTAAEKQKSTATTLRKAKPA